MTSVERQIRTQLGIPDDAASILILGMDAHMDWDWVSTFQDYLTTGAYGGPVTTIIEQAWQCMSENQEPNNAYLYSVCEMGFLRAALELKPDLITQYKTNNLNKQLSIQGGGITSPDNLLPHGEAFLRNYLVGLAWQRATLGLPATYAYLPDDFGHDAQLPVMLEAMGFAGVSFSRIPGSWGSKEPLSGDSLYKQLMQKDGADLFWQASDGSSVFTHLLQNSYCQGSTYQCQPLSSYCDNLPGAMEAVRSFLNYNQPSSPSPYVYVPCGCDFALPISCLLDIANYCNAQKLDSTHVVVGTLEQYMQLVQAWSSDNPGKLVKQPMDPTPYWTGFYASRPANKILHHATVRELLAAEVFGAVADLLLTTDNLAWESVRTARRQALAQGWEALLPSTHHDYITGTAVQSVYTEEQQPLLRAAYAIAEGTRQTTVQEIATLIGAKPGPDETPVLVLNQLGFGTSGLVEIPALPGRTFKSVRSEDNLTGPVQTTPDGKLLFLASAPSLGYATYYLSDRPDDESTVSASLSPDGNYAYLQNSRMIVALSKAQGWAIASCQPIVDGQPSGDLIPDGQVANGLTFYLDLGNIYQFGNEVISENGLAIVDGQLVSKDAQILEGGPLRARVQAEVTFSDGTSQADYTLEYTLAAGEPFLRMAVTGSVPLPPDPNKPGPDANPYAVMVRFPFTAGVDNVLRGTPYHWHDQLPTPYWEGPTFQATHRFVVPTHKQAPLGALYHADVPAWAIDVTGAMIGCVLRNTPNEYPWTVPKASWANGVDFGVHTRSYALRVPQGLELPPSGISLFKESLSYAMPLQGAYVNVPSSGFSGRNFPVNVSLPTNFSLASIISGNAILTVAKEGQFNPGAMILRLYQPFNVSQTVTLSLANYIKSLKGSSPQVLPVTALEQSIQGAQPLPVTGGQVALKMNRALATLAVTPGGDILSSA